LNKKEKIIKLYLTNRKRDNIITIKEREKERKIMKNTEMNTKIAKTEIEIRIDDRLFRDWVNFLDAKLKTVETYTKAIKQFSKWLKAKGITKPTRQDIVNYRDFVAENHKPTTVNGYLMAVKQFFKWTEINRLYPNVSVNVKSLRLDNGFKKDALTAHQVSQILTSVDRDNEKGLRDYAILLLMTTTGLRTIEIQRANIEDLCPLGDYKVLYIQGKGHNEKTDYVKIEPVVEEAINKYLEVRGAEKCSDPLFASVANRNRGKRITTRSISRIVKNNMLAAGLNSKRITAHSLRHTAATLNLLSGGTVEETRQLLRHSNINTTMIYVHSLERAFNNSEARIVNAIINA